MARVSGRGLGGSLSGEAIVLPQTFTFFGGVDWATGRLLGGGKGVAGETISGRILVFRSPSGGQGTAWKIAEMVEMGTAPAALVSYLSNSVFVSGCIMAGVPYVTDTDVDPTTLFRTGDTLLVDGAQGSATRLEGHGA